VAVADAHESRCFRSLYRPFLTIRLRASRESQDTGTAPSLIEGLVATPRAEWHLPNDSGRQ